MDTLTIKNDEGTWVLRAYPFGPGFENTITGEVIEPADPNAYQWSEDQLRDWFLQWWNGLEVVDGED